MVDEAFPSVGPHRLSVEAGPIAARIGEQVRAWRIEARISEDELAASLRLTIDDVRSAEAGKSRFTAEEIVAICERYDVGPSRFLNDLL